jgi:hypothetical protein
MTVVTDIGKDRRRRLANQALFRHYFVKCSCERGCPVCAYTGLVSRGHAKHARADQPGQDGVSGTGA